VIGPWLKGRGGSKSRLSRLAPQARASRNTCQAPRAPQGFGAATALKPLPPSAPLKTAPVRFSLWFPDVGGSGRLPGQWWLVLIACLSLGVIPSAWARPTVGLEGRAEAAWPRCVRDDRDREVCVSAPPQRVVALAPHLVEWMFTLEAMPRLKGVSRHSDWPPAARALPQVGAAGIVDRVELLRLEPDLVLVWSESGQRGLELLETQFAVPLFYSSPQTLDDIVDGLQRLAWLLGVDPAPAAALRQRLESMRDAADPLLPGPAVWLLWPQPLYAVGGRGVQADVLRACGLDNVLAPAERAALAWSLARLLQARPAWVLRPRGSGAEQDWARLEQRLPAATWVAVDADVFSRPTPRLIEALPGLCRELRERGGLRPQAREGAD